jgi:deoxyribose-phosphate aldolase
MSSPPQERSGAVTPQPAETGRQTEPVLDAREVGRIVRREMTVDAVALEERAASLAERSIEQEFPTWALDLAIRSMDLTTLEGSDTPDRIVALCAKAVRPNPLDDSIPSVAALCIYPQLVPVAVGRLRGTGVKVASVAGGFPAGLTPLDARLLEIRDVVDMGANEVDIVLNRSLFLSGRYERAFEELAAARATAGETRLKVILETGELGTYERIRQASMLAMAAGADFIKTSTGKIGVGATLPSALCMMEAIREFHHETGRRVGFKAAGGIRRSTVAIRYLRVLSGTLGPEWMTPEGFRIGASSLLDDVLVQIDRERTGRHRGDEDVTLEQ